ncbi:MAG: endospore germination permease [Tissierellia bacterium]|nr:endospore germination permease [Tissierellia bacterium]
MNNKYKISHIQLRGLIVSTSVGVGVLSQSGHLSEIMGNSGWIAIMLTWLLIIPLFAIYNKIFELYPGKDIFQIGREVFGRLIFTILIAIVLADYILTLALITRNLAELIKIFLLQTTPLEVLLISFILASSYIACSEIEVIARASYFMYPLIILFAVIIVLISLPRADFTRILPLFQTDIPSILKGVKDNFFSFIGFEVVLFAIPFLEKKENAFKSEVMGITTVMIIYVALYIMAISHFSMAQMTSIVYPILMLIRQLDLPGFFLENLDGLVIAFWVIVVFSTVAPIYYASGKIAANIFGVKKHKYFILMLIPVIYIIAMIPDNFIELLQDVSRYHNILAFIAIVVIPTIILIAALIRKKVFNK